MRVPKNVILIHVGTHAGIPDGYDRETSLDAKYPKGTATSTNPNSTGGNATHSHSATANHSHTASGTHVHSVDFGYTNSPLDDRNGTSGLHEHKHASANSASATGGSLSSVASTYSAIDNDPPYYEVIFIKSDGSKGVPDDCVVLGDDGDLIPSNWFDCDGNNSTPNLHDKYLKGADTGQDAGSTGGSLTNVHDLVHTHSVASHSHGNAESGNTTNALEGDVWGGTPEQGSLDWADRNHTHTFSLQSASDTISATNPEITTTETVEPAHTKLMAIQNKTGDFAPAYRGIIGLWLGTLKTIPHGWVLCDGNNGTVNMRSRHLKIGTSAQVGDTGGSNTHTHSNDSHTHTSTGHTHGLTMENHTAFITYNSGHNGGYTSRPFTDEEDTHQPNSTVNTATVTYNSATTNADSQNNEPEYRTVAFIKFKGAGKGSSYFLLN